MQKKAAKQTLESFSFVGTQYIACVVSMLIVLTSITPSFAQKSARAIRKGLKSSISREVTSSVGLVQTPISTAGWVSIPASELSKSIFVGVEHGVSVAQQRKVPQPQVAILLKNKEMAQAMSKFEEYAKELPSQFRDFIQIYKRMQKLANQEDTPQAREAVLKEAENAITCLEKLLVEMKSTTVHTEKVKELLNQAKVTLMPGKEITKEQIENLSQKGQALVNNMLKEEPALQKKVVNKVVNMERPHNSSSSSNAYYLPPLHNSNDELLGCLANWVLPIIVGCLLVILFGLVVVGGCLRIYQGN